MDNPQVKTVEEFILAQKYPRLNRKARTIQQYVERGWKVLIPGPDLFVLRTSSRVWTWTVSISGSSIFPTVNEKWEKNKMDSETS